MSDWETDLTTQSGFRFHVRPVCLDDEAALGEFFKKVTPEDLRFRFLGTVKAVDHQRLSAMINVDHRQTESFVASESAEGEFIAVAMLACDPSMTTAEVAVSIRPDHKSRGVSWELLRHLTRFAEAQGIKRIQSVEDRLNVSAIQLEKEMGFASRPYEGETNLVVLEKELNSAA